MRITLSCAMFVAFTLFGNCGGTDSTPRPGFCGDQNNALTAVDFSSDIATRADQVPIELQGCGLNREEITAIRIVGRVSGCVDGTQAGLTFPTLTVIFTTDAARCQGSQGLLPNRSVTMTNVKYTASISSGSSPACIGSSFVTWIQFQTNDPAYSSLFQLRGPQTMLPILDRFALGWAASVPSSASCPPVPIFGGTTARCPR